MSIPEGKAEWSGVGQEWLLGLEKDRKRCDHYLTGVKQGFRAGLRFLSFVVSDTLIKRIMRLVLRSQHRGGNQAMRLWGGKWGVGHRQACSSSPPLYSHCWWWEATEGIIIQRRHPFGFLAHWTNTQISSKLMDRGNALGAFHFIFPILFSTKWRE